MASLTNYTADALRDAVLRNIAFTSPTTVYLALFTTPTNPAGGGTEVTGGLYTRQAVTFNALGGGHGIATNTVDVAFVGMPACTVTHAAIFDDPTAGNMLLEGPISSPKILNAGDTHTFASGDLDVAFT